MSQNAQKSGHQPSLMMILINDVLEDLHEAKNEIRAVRHENKELRDEIQEQQIYIDEQNKADEAQVNAVVQRNSRVTGERFIIFHFRTIYHCRALEISIDCNGILF